MRKKREKRIGIYKVTSPKSKIYIGQSIDLEQRFRSYKSLNNCKTQVKLYKSLLKHGAESHTFEIITECYIDQLNSLERYYQDLYNASGKNGLNCLLTTSRTRAGQMSEETKDKIRASCIGINQGPRSEETKLKLRLANLGKKATDEAKAKMSAAHKGNKYNSGRVHGEQMRQKTSERMKGNSYSKGFKHSEETRRKVSESSKQARLVLNTQSGIFYSSVKEAADSMGKYDVSHILLMLKGKHPNKTNFIFA